MQKNKIAKWSKRIFIAEVIIILYYLFEDNEWFKWISIIALLLVFPLFNMWKQRDMFTTGLRGIEAAIWGKPLDKELWEKGEMKNTKVEMTFKGKKMSIKNLIPKKKIFTNKHAGATFFAFFVVFFFIFTTNHYTMNLVFAIIMLQLSLYFKTADLIRQNYDELQEIKGFLGEKYKEE